MMQTATRFADLKNKLSKARVIREGFEGMAGMVTMLESEMARHTEIVVLAVHAADEGRVIKHCILIQL
jgi:hypothetical protein